MGFYKFSKFSFELGISFLLIYNFLYILVNANLNCNLVDFQRYFISSKDFSLTRFDSKYIWCAAYFCSHSPTVLPLQLTVHSINYKADSIIVHLEEKSISFRDLCHECGLEFNSTDKCKPCPKIERSKGIEVHVRYNNDGSSKSKSEMCSSMWDLNFNMSLVEFSCKQSKSAVYIATDNVCDVKFDTATSMMCIRPTCSKEIILKNMTEKFIHKFDSDVMQEVCLWELFTVPHKHLEIIFSPNLQNYLSIFDNTLLRPKWKLGFCDIANNTFKVKPTSHTLFLLYNNTEPLDQDSYIEVKVEEDLCDIPSSLPNGNIETKASDKELVIMFTCNKNYQIVGSSEFVCGTNDAVVPTCILLDNGNLMSDDPKFSNPSMNDQPPSAIKPIDIPGSKLPEDMTQTPENIFKGKLASDGPDIGKGNSSIIEFDKNHVEATKSVLEAILPTSSFEGSGQLYTEYEDTELDSDDSLLNETLFDLYNETHINNGSFVHPWRNSDLVLFSIPELKANLITFIIVGVSVLAIVIITVISLIVCRSKRHSHLNRKFDTFQNPIYEKPVIPIPIIDSDQEKIDLGDLSDSTVLD